MYQIVSPIPNHRHFLISYVGARVCRVAPGTRTKIVNITTKPEFQSLCGKNVDANLIACQESRYFTRLDGAKMVVFSRSDVRADSFVRTMEKKMRVALALTESL